MSPAFIAHSKNMAVFAFNDNDEIGIDIETKRELIDISSIAKKMFSLSECNYLSAAVNKHDIVDRFLTVWTRKEAVVKATCEGLAAPVNTITTTLRNGAINPAIDYIRPLNLTLIDLPKIKNCFATLATNMNKKHLDYLTLTP